MATNPDPTDTDGPDQTGHEVPEDDCGCTGSSGGDCDPDLLDDLTCRAAGVAKQAEYNAQAKPALDAARAEYPAIRTAYRTARSEGAKELQALRHQVKQLLERVRCQIKQDKVIDCLDEAFCVVVKKLDQCGGESGCCSSGACEFDTSCPAAIEELLSRKAEYEARLTSEKECFDRLKGEPAALTARIAAAKAEIDAAAAALDGDQAVLDLPLVYVSLLVAQRHLRDVWGGFDCTQDFLDCLCHALTCWIKATEAVSLLSGHLAIKECRRDEAKKRCEDLATNTVEAVLMEYERLCGGDSSDECEDQPTDECKDDEEDDSCDDDESEEEPDDTDECNCGNEHHHRHGRTKEPWKQKSGKKHGRH